MKQIFCKKSIKKSKNSALKIWNKHNFLFEYCAETTIEKILEVKKKFQNILLISSDKNELFSKIKKINYQNLIFVSQYNEIVKKLEINNTNEFKIVQDFENLSLTKKKFDLIICNLCLHRINDVKEFCKKIKNLSSLDGLVVCSYFGGKSLYELRQSLIHADQILKKGFYQRIIPFIDMLDITNIFTTVGFKEIVSDVTKLKIKFNNQKKLLLDIKGMGETNNLKDRFKGLYSKKFFQQSEFFYKKNFSDENNKLTASCDIIFLVMWNNNTG